MNNSQARRKIMLDIIRQRTMQFGGLQVNRSGCPSLKHSEEINYLLDKGHINRKSKPDSSWGRSLITRTMVYVADMDTSYLRRVTCPFCKVEVKHWADLGGSLHKDTCTLRWEKF